MKIQHPLVFYYLTTFAISWGVVFWAVGGFGGLPGKPSETEEHLLAIILATVGGPSIAGLTMSFLMNEMSDYRKRLLKWEAWYPLIGLFAPACLGSLLAILCVTVSSELFLPEILRTNDRVGVIGMGLGYGFIAGLFEELGWTGFAVPETRKRHGVVRTGLLVGLFWGLWHFLVAVWGSGKEDGSFDYDLFVGWIPWNLMVLPFYRVLMVALYEKTQSILSMAIMHGSLTASLPLILMPPATGHALAAFYTLFAIVLGAWIVGLVKPKKIPRRSGTKVD